MHCFKDTVRQQRNYNDNCSLCFEKKKTLILQADVCELIQLELKLYAYISNINNTLHQRP